MFQGTCRAANGEPLASGRKVLARCPQPVLRRGWRRVSGRGWRRGEARRGARPALVLAEPGTSVSGERGRATPGSARMEARELAREQLLSLGHPAEGHLRELGEGLLSVIRRPHGHLGAFYPFSVHGKSGIHPQGWPSAWLLRSALSIPSRPATGHSDHSHRRSLRFCPVLSV